jgi:alpha-L-fucosidase
MLATLAHGFSYPSAYVEGDTFYVFVASTHADGLNARGPFDIHVFCSTDLEHWTSRMAVPHEPGERNINSSVCKGPDGYVMAYETNAYVPFTIKFARSQDLLHWQKVADVAWRKEKYTACPALRYHEGYYYMFYLNQTEGQWHFETHLARSKDLVDWEESPLNPVLTPLPEEGINNSDIDMLEHEG